MKKNFPIISPPAQPWLHHRILSQARQVPSSVWKNPRKVRTTRNTFWWLLLPSPFIVTHMRFWNTIFIIHNNEFQTPFPRKIRILITWVFAWLLKFMTPKSNLLPDSYLTTYHSVWVISFLFYTASKEIWILRETKIKLQTKFEKNKNLKGNPKLKNENKQSNKEI